MPEYLAPGVYVEEISTGPKPIEGVGTSTAGFAGRTERGPTTPRLVTSWIEYQRWFGTHLDPRLSYLPFAVQGFFENGGKRVFIARVVAAGTAMSTRNFETDVEGGSRLVATALGPGAWGNNLLMRIDRGSRADLNAEPPRDLFRVTLLYYRNGVPSPFVDPANRANLASPFYRDPDATEVYDNLSAVHGSANYVLSAINSGSRLVHLDWEAETGSQPVPARPRNEGFGTAASVQVETSDPATQLELTARGEGAWGNDVRVDIEDGTTAGAVKITARLGSFSEQFDNLTSDRLDEVLNRGSRLVRAEWRKAEAEAEAPPRASRRSRNEAAGGEGGAPPEPPPEPAAAPADTGPLPKRAKNIALKEGTDLRFSPVTEPEIFSATDYIGKGTVPANQRTGLAGLEAIDEIALLAVPDAVNESLTPEIRGELTNAVLDQCERLRDRFAILSVERGQGTVQDIYPVRDTSYGAIYYPWIRVFEQRTQDTILVPPTGHVAGIYARTDIERGVHKAPANEVVRGIVTRDLNAERGPLEYRISKGEHDILNPRGINVIRDFRADRRGIRVWGARTMSSDPEWKYVNVRRLFIYIEESIDEGTQWVVFEPNDEPTWARVRRSVENFLVRVWRDGALMGLTQDEAFFVKCDRTTMTQDDIDNGRLICYIGIAPVKPAEFVIFRISQKTADAPQ